MSSTRILLVDDDVTVLQALSTKLSLLPDVLVQTTADPTAVLKVAKVFQPRLILCDVDMEPIDGGTVMQELQEDKATARIPFVFLTSLVDPEQIARNNGVIGGRRMISKQSSLKDIIKRICLEADMPLPGPGLTTVPFPHVPKP